MSIVFVARSSAKQAAAIARKAQLSAAFTASIAEAQREIARDLNALERKALPKAYVGALNQFGAAANKGAIDEVASKLKLPRKLIKPRSRVSKASISERRAQYVIRVEHRGLSYYSTLTPAQQAAAKRKRKGGRLRGRGGRVLQGAFVVRVGTADVVFQREGKARLPIRAPRIGIRERQLAAYESRTDFDRSPRARAGFNAIFERRLAAELRRRGLR